jgi:inner membrane protein
MDPVSQAAFGASLSQSFVKDRSLMLTAFALGALSGMAADLDILIQSDTDPLLFLEYHRQFTHSLVFIPVGALLCSLLVLLFYRAFKTRERPSFRQLYLFCFLGYATHALLDACTSYGTQLFWPFSHERVAWNVVSIIDPLFTLPLLVLIILAVIKRNPWYARYGFIYAVLFLFAGLIQKHRAEEQLYLLAESRGHQVERMQVKPSFGNRHLWKLIYESGGRYYVDAVKLLWTPEIIEGDSIRKLNVRLDYPWLPEDSQQAKDIERFRWFSDGYLAVSPDDPMMIIDMRYSVLPDRIRPMWGIILDKYYVDRGMPHHHVDYRMFHQLDKKTRDEFFDMLF